MKKPNVHVNQRTFVIAFIACLVLIAAGILFGTGRFNRIPQFMSAVTHSNNKENFPDITMSLLSEKQQKIVILSKQEFDAQPPGTKYSEGVDEPWCADFVSWIMKNAGYPLENPNSGYWRIPGTFTLREYYESINKFHTADSDYTPKVGDVMLYDNPSPFGQHTNIIIKNDNGRITTVGGNEPGGIRVVTHVSKDRIGFIGYGSLE